MRPDRNWLTYHHKEDSTNSSAHSWSANDPFAPPQVTLGITPKPTSVLTPQERQELFQKISNRFSKNVSSYFPHGQHDGIHAILQRASNISSDGTVNVFIIAFHHEHIPSRWRMRGGWTSVHVRGMCRRQHLFDARFLLNYTKQG